MFFLQGFSFTGILPELSSNFSVQRQNIHGFSAVACDQTIEQTVNRDSKTNGGLVVVRMLCWEKATGKQISLSMS